MSPPLRIPTFLLGLALAVTCQSVLAQQPGWYVQSPSPAQVIGDGELFIAVALNSEIAIDETTVVVTIDGVDFTRRAKVTTESVRLLYTSRLGAGRHEVHVEGHLLSGKRLADLDWHFVVEGDPIAEGPRRALSNRTMDFRGKTLIDTRNSDISGNRDLRQEPVRSYVVRADAEGQYGAFTFPVKLHLTTDESAVTQPRNRYMIGVRGPMFALYGGDYNPRLAPLILNGARTRGFHGEFHAAGFHVETTIGRLRRGLEGRALDVPIDEPLQISAGTYARSLTAVKLGFGNEQSVLMSFTGLKARDDTSSISFGQNPMENLVVGSDLSARFLEGKLRFRTGGAISITTNDITRGPATKAEIDSLFNTDLPIDPSDFDWLITLNASTVPIRLDKLTSSSWYFNTRMAAPGHTLSAEIRTVGSAYFSAANPFLQADRRTFTLSDRFRLDNGRYTGIVRYQYYASLPDGGNRLKLRSNLLEARLSVLTRPGLPQFTTGLRTQWRQRGYDMEDPLASEMRVITASLGATHSFKTGAVSHAGNLFYTRTARRDKINTLYDNTTHAISVGVSERYPASFHSNVQLTHLIVNYTGELGRQRWTTLAGTLGYRFYDDAADVALTVKNTHAGATAFSGRSDRFGLIFTGSMELRNNMTIELQAGYDDYSEEGNPTGYSEKFVRLRHRYTF